MTKITEKLDRGQITSSQSVDTIKKQVLFIHDEDKDEYILWDGKLRGTSLVFDRTGEDLLKEIIVQLKLISLKLDCLQPDDQELDVNDLDDITQ